MKKLLPVVAGILVAGAVVGALVGVGRLPAGSEETGGAGGGELRWLNVTLQLPIQGSPLGVIRDIPHGPEEPRYLIHVYDTGARPPEPGSEGAWNELQIDAETGEVVSDTLSAALSDQAVLSQLQALVDSVQVVTGPPEAWPYVDVAAPPPEPFKWGNLAYIVPDPASGIIVSPTSGICPASPPDCVSQALAVTNGRSEMGIRGDTGQVETWQRVLAQDREAFERYAASVQVSAAGDGGTP